MSGYRTNGITVDMRVIAHNARCIRAHVPAAARVMAVVKANAYGHGAVDVAKTVLANGCGALAVALVEEGVQLRDAGIDAPILVLGGIEPEAANAVAEYNLTQTVFDADTLAVLEAAGVSQHRRVAVQLKLDTGMGRIGVRDQASLQRLTEQIRTSPHLTLDGAFTHFATADMEPDNATFKAQQARFAASVAYLKAQAPGLCCHASNSAALLRMPSLAYDQVRAGIVLYGAPPVPTDLPVREAMRWHTRAVYIKEVPAGMPISYGGTFVTRRTTRVMTIPVGYADGYRRALSNRAQVLVCGKRAPIIGRVCMDQTMVDVTDIPEARVGDEVVLMGAQGDAYLSATELAEWADTISYEMFLAPSARVTRQVIPA